MVCILDAQDSPSLLCLEPSLNVITRKELIYVFGVHNAYYENEYTKDYPKLALFLKNALDKMDSIHQQHGNATKSIKQIQRFIERINDKVILSLLEDAARQNTTVPIDITNSKLQKLSTRCAANHTVAFAPMLILNYVCFNTYF